MKNDEYIKTRESKPDSYIGKKKKAIVYSYPAVSRRT
jgi:hypothetical protein